MRVVRLRPAQLRHGDHVDVGLHGILLRAKVAKQLLQEVIRLVCGKIPGHLVEAFWFQRLLLVQIVVQRQLRQMRTERQNVRMEVVEPIADGPSLPMLAALTARVKPLQHEVRETPKHRFGDSGDVHIFIVVQVLHQVPVATYDEWAQLFAPLVLQIVAIEGADFLFPLRAQQIVGNDQQRLAVVATRFEQVGGDCSQRGIGLTHANLICQQHASDSSLVALTDDRGGVTLPIPVFLDARIRCLFVEKLFHGADRN